MKKIYKYPFDLIAGENHIMLPKGAEILSIQVQHNEPCIWAIVDTEEKENEFREFFIIGTGFELPENLTRLYVFRTALQFDNGALVYHVFERRT